ncbi:UDP-N-acetylmuramoyl-L-alanine--D-glutamate ligase [soil metagenome]
MSAQPPPTAETPSWPGLRVVVGGLGVTGFTAADSLLQLGAAVTVLADRDDADARDRGSTLQILGAEVRLGAGATAELPASAQLLVASPGLPPSSPLLEQAVRRGVPLWGEVELAWRLRPVASDGLPAPWLTVTGTNGKTTTVQMLDAMLRAAGLRSAAVGNVGTPVLEAVRHPEPYDVLAVELSSFQLHTTSSLSAAASVVLNVAPDHLDWHGSYAAYRAAKARIYEGTRIACVYPLADDEIEQLVQAADVVEGCRVVGFTTGVPPPGSVGVVDGVIADRAFVTGRDRQAAELGSVDDITPLAPHTLVDALAAAALARAQGVPPAAVRDGLRSFRPGTHRITTAGRIDGVGFVDDSKATNPHAARASLSGYESVVWVAGGLAKGAQFDGLVRAVRTRLRAAVLLGRDRGLIAEALRRHAPDVPVIEVPDGETGTQVMQRVVAAAVSVAQPGDTVLLAPACASQDQFRDYGARGDAFAAAVRARGCGALPPQ